MAPEIIAVSDEQQITTGTSDVLSARHPPAVSNLPTMQSSVMIRRVRRRKRRQAATHATLAVGSALYLLLVVRTGLETLVAPDWTIRSGGGGPLSSSSPDASHLPSVDEWELRQKEEANIAQFDVPEMYDSYTGSHEHSDSRSRSRSLTKRSESSSSSSERHFRTAARSRNFAAYSCESLNDHLTTTTTAHGPLSKELQCAFARTCNDGDGIFAPLVYCHPTWSPRQLLLLLGPPLLLFLAVLFRILGSTAEEFFSPGLEMFSLKMGLPERFAGVTLLALGNGAPDVASTVNAILDDRKRGYLMALGELTGAAMVASTLIVGSVVYVAADQHDGGGVPCRGAMVRDVVFFVLLRGWEYNRSGDPVVRRAVRRVRRAGAGERSVSQVRPRAEAGPEEGEEEGCW